jgi:hypothetical protein
LNEGRYFDVFVEYAKASPEDILVRITAHNRGVTEEILHLIPHIWFRNTWAWGIDPHKPVLCAQNEHSIQINHHGLGRRRWLQADGSPRLLFTNNDTNTQLLYGSGGPGYFKDGIHRFVVNGDTSAVNAGLSGTKAAAHYQLSIPGNGSAVVRLRLSDRQHPRPFSHFHAMFDRRIKEADGFYQVMQAGMEDEDARNVHRQALAGMLWSKQFYYFDISQWLKGDPGQPLPSPQRYRGRNSQWGHLNNKDIISMPDKWEYP